MARGKVIDAFNWLAFAGAGIYLLGAATPLGAPQDGSNARPPSLSRRADSTKPTWHSGPASTPPQTEVVLPPPPNPPPAKSTLLGSQGEGKKSALRKPWAVTPVGSRFLGPSAAAHEPAPTPNAIPHDDPNAVEPEAQRIRVELNRLRNDAAARCAFYDELRRTVEQVRAGLRDEDSKNPASPRPAWHRFHDASGEPPNPPATDKPDEPPPANRDAPQASLGSLVGAGLVPALGAQPQASLGSLVGAGLVPAPGAHSQPFLGTRRGSLSDQLSPLPLGGEGGPPPVFSSAGAGRVRGSRSANATVDRAAYLRVVRCAKANDAPVPLALAVAWIESHLQTYPPRGAAGEVGMFQILPARCRLEGWPPKRLKEPEFNAWLGTRLLARYYREEGSWARAAAKYVAGPRVFARSYSPDLWAYINWYASSVDSYAGYFSQYQG